MSSLGKHVIHRPRPYRTALFIISAMLLGAGYVWFYLTASASSVEQELAVTKEREQSLSLENQKLTERLATLTSEFNDQKQYISIQQATDAQLQKRLDELQNKVVHLNKELMFYQTITQGNSSAKLQIREFELHRPSPTQPTQSSYRLVLTQGQKINKPLTGQIKVEVSDANNKTIQLSEHNLNLRHVQVVEGMIELPKAMTPTSVNVSLIQNKKTTLTQRFDWQFSE